ncbi:MULTISPECIES: DsbC family protein [Paraburkholderia]|uniref:Thiol:disulfide interchange protein n=1 Tax=Paraburkholderia madseniana TaxID=2599607 RepID=A0AAP5BN11_9BURK|nr:MULTISPECIES: DsbC family protein [Paraburkholderia]MCX4151045.1 DsbC family protein [Paraburkholderia madseniana]MCX4176685.1 DsbC family protein [Paraburkholderia madseniana]MDN7153977.1 DsbC family protein [Paraburkholderia sp. WS6]MDQ6412859.1 DsbC family protein [Paraburkholderia madseniana]MDQ6464676.1 DsbC family protein [Paraburkholderia madseniana]
MRYWLKSIVACMCAVYALVAHADFQADLVKRFPATEGAKVAPAFPGFWSVLKGGEVFFVNDDLSILIPGDVINLKTRHSLATDIKEAGRPKIDVTTLDVRDAIKFGNGSHRLYVFDDPDCPYCRHLDGDLSRLHDATIYVFPFPLTSLHPNAANVAEAIWCQRDRAQAWSDYQRMARDTSTAVTALGAATATDPNELEAQARLRLKNAWLAYLHAHRQPDQPTCDNPIDRNLALGQKLNIFGTPALIFADGSLIPGAVSAERIEAQFRKVAMALAGAGK